MDIKFYLASGKVVNANDNFAGVDLNDVGYSLDQEYRFNGNSPFSVWFHTFLCVKTALQLTDNRNIILGLLTHDFPEMFIRDIPTQVKSLCPGLVELENTFLQQISKTVCNFDWSLVTEEEKAFIHNIDKTLGELEFRHIFNHGGWEENPEIAYGEKVWEHGNINLAIYATDSSFYPDSLDIHEFFNTVLKRYELK